MTLNYASAANIEEVMKFYNLGDKTFEADFSHNGRECVIRFVDLPHSVMCTGYKSVMLQTNKSEF